jgi:hypothetical protein
VNEDAAGKSGGDSQIKLQKSGGFRFANAELRQPVGGF